MYREKFQHVLKTNNFSSDEIRNMFIEKTFSRSELIGFINMNTIQGVGVNNFPCNTVSGLKPGSPCSFPFLFPDCELSVKAKLCGRIPPQQPIWHERCTEADICFTRTYQNNSAMLGQWGDCNANCSSSVRWEIWQQLSEREKRRTLQNVGSSLQPGQLSVREKLVPRNLRHERPQQWSLFHL